MKIYEIYLEGFDSSTDKTDNLVKWIAASNKSKIEKFIKDYDIKVDPKCSIQKLNIPWKNKKIGSKIKLLKLYGIDYILL